MRAVQEQASEKGKVSMMGENGDEIGTGCSSKAHREHIYDYFGCEQVEFFPQKVA